MDIPTRLRELGAVDIAALKSAVEGLPAEAWLEDQSRQNVFEVHKATQSVVLCFCEGWPDLKVVRRPGFDLLAEVALPVMATVVAAGYAPGGTVIRCMVAKLLSGGMIPRHYDAHPSFAIGHRIHVPLVTNPDVRFMLDDAPVFLKPGFAYEINNQKYHEVENRGDEARIHFIFDYVAPRPAAAA